MPKNNDGLIWKQNIVYAFNGELLGLRSGQVLSRAAAWIQFEYIPVHRRSPKNTNSLCFSLYELSKVISPEEQNTEKLLGTGGEGKQAVDECFYKMKLPRTSIFIVMRIYLTLLNWTLKKSEDDQVYITWFFAIIKGLKEIVKTLCSFFYFKTSLYEKSYLEQSIIYVDLLQENQTIK